jgi:hypothetical protein
MPSPAQGAAALLLEVARLRPDPAAFFGCLYYAASCAVISRPRRASSSPPGASVSDGSRRKPASPPRAAGSSGPADPRAGWSRAWLLMSCGTPSCWGELRNF